MLTLMVSRWEVEVVLSVTTPCGVRCPQLLADPLDILHLQCDTVINDFSPNSVHRDHMVIGHIILVPSVVERYVALSVVRGVHVNTPVERVGRRVRDVDAGQKLACHGDACAVDACGARERQSVRMSWLL